MSDFGSFNNFDDFLKSIRQGMEAGITSLEQQADAENEALEAKKLSRQMAVNNIDFLNGLLDKERKMAIED